MWLPGLGDRWPLHRRLCRLSTHAYLSSYLAEGRVGEEGGRDAGRRDCLNICQVQAGSATPQGGPDPFLSQHPPPNLGVSLSLCLLSHLQSPGWPCELAVWFTVFWHAVLFTLLAAYLRRGAHLILSGSKGEYLSWAKCNGQHARELSSATAFHSRLCCSNHAAHVCLHP